MRLEHHLHVVGGYVRYISPHIIIIIIIIMVVVYSTCYVCVVKQIHTCRYLHVHVCIVWGTLYIAVVRW